MCTDEDEEYVVKEERIPDGYKFCISFPVEIIVFESLLQKLGCGAR